MVDHGSNNELHKLRNVVSAFVALSGSRARVRADTFFNEDIVRDPRVSRLSFFFNFPGFFGSRLFLGFVNSRADFAELESERHVIVAFRRGAIDRFFD